MDEVAWSDRLVNMIMMIINWRRHLISQFEGKNEEGKKEVFASRARRHSWLMVVWRYVFQRRSAGALSAPWFIWKTGWTSPSPLSLPTFTPVIKNPTTYALWVQARAMGWLRLWPFARWFSWGRRGTQWRHPGGGQRRLAKEVVESPILSGGLTKLLSQPGWDDPSHSSQGCQLMWQPRHF